MASSPPTTRTKFLLLLTLYAARGLPFGFFTQALPVIMRQQEYALRVIGLSHLLALPCALKWLWAPLCDRLYHKRWGPPSKLDLTSPDSQLFGHGFTRPAGQG